MTNKPLCIIRAPVATRSGYGEMSRDIVRHIIELDLYDVKVDSCPWGNTPTNALNPNVPKDKLILDAIMPQGTKIPQRPDLFISITIPNEFQPMGTYNIGITAGIETTMCAKDWIDGCNRMHTVWCISEHAKRVLEMTVYEERGPQGQPIRQIKATVPMEVLHNCIDNNIIKKIYLDQVPKTIRTTMASIKESFCFLFVGHWLQGNLGHDRKDVGMLIRTFLETFKNKPNKPALILKTSGGNFSNLDRDEILFKINEIRNVVASQDLPNIYLLHGELTEEEMNGLYNHPKVKAHVSLTKGEGFGRPLLEATISQKPVLASGWSGHLDFLNPEECILLAGSLEKVGPEGAWGNIVLPDAEWFRCDYNYAANAMMAVYTNYEQYRLKAVRLGKKNFDKFSYINIRNRTAELLKQYVTITAKPKVIQLSPSDFGGMKLDALPPAVKKKQMHVVEL